MASKDTFERKEKKFVLTKDQFETFLSKAKDRLEEDDYHVSDIVSVYYDTDDYDVIRTSLSKPKYKEKLRIRDYGTGEVFVELKKKVGGIVYKRRFATSHNVVSSWLDEGLSFEESIDRHMPGHEMTFMEKQVSREVESFCKRYSGGLSKTMSIRAHRLSYREKDSTHVTRITFDTGIWYTDLKSEAEEKKLTEFVVMEAKLPGAYPMWLLKILSEMELRPTSFSKYGNAYKKVVSKNADDKVDNLARPSMEPTILVPNVFPTRLAFPEEMVIAHA